jgi:protein phosphatase 2C family protein 2/3
MERSRAFSVRQGRIILLGDGTEIISDQNEEELFNQTEEQDLANQVHPTDSRSEREGTPGPQGKQDEAGGAAQISESPASTDDKEKSTSA